MKKKTITQKKVCDNCFKEISQGQFCSERCRREFYADMLGGDD